MSKQLITVVVICFVAAFLIAYMMKHFTNIMNGVIAATGDYEHNDIAGK
ncbi:MAG: hypothetical protein HYV59_02025 [Planctomycetes bacterium]|nr:hypothetical protein [Planctomycetota bacterium]